MDDPILDIGGVTSDDWLPYESLGAEGTSGLCVDTSESSDVTSEALVGTSLVLARDGVWGLAVPPPDGAAIDVLVLMDFFVVTVTSAVVDSVLTLLVCLGEATFESKKRRLQSNSLGRAERKGAFEHVQTQQKIFTHAQILTRAFPLHWLYNFQLFF